MKHYIFSFLVFELCWADLQFVCLRMNKENYYDLPNFVKQDFGSYCDGPDMLCFNTFWNFLTWTPGEFSDLSVLMENFDFGFKNLTSSQIKDSCEELWIGFNSMRTSSPLVNWNFSWTTSNLVWTV